MAGRAGAKPVVVVGAAGCAADAEAQRALGPDSALRTGRRRQGLEARLLLLGLAIAWGTAFLFTGVAVVEVSPELLVAARLGVAAAALNLARVALGRALPREPRVWLRLVPVAVTGSVLPFWLISWGQQEVPSGLAGVLMAVSPLVTVGLAHFTVSSEPLDARRLLGVVLGLGGVVALFGPQSLAGLGSADSLLHQLAVLGGAVLYAVNTVITRRLAPLHPVAFSSGVLLVAFAIALPVGLTCYPTSAREASLGAWLAVAWLGLVPTGLATLAYYRLVSTEGAGFASLVSYAIPVIALLAGALALGEAVAPSTLAALALILLGVAVVRAPGAPGPRSASLADRSRGA